MNAKRRRTRALAVSAPLPDDDFSWSWEPPGATLQSPNRFNASTTTAPSVCVKRSERVTFTPPALTTMAACALPLEAADLSGDVAAGFKLLASSPPLWPIGADDWTIALVIETGAKIP